MELYGKLSDTQLLWIITCTCLDIVIPTHRETDGQYTSTFYLQGAGVGNSPSDVAD